MKRLEAIENRAKSYRVKNPSLGGKSFSNKLSGLIGIPNVISGKVINSSSNPRATVTTSASVLTTPLPPYGQKVENMTPEDQIKVLASWNERCQKLVDAGAYEQLVSELIEISAQVPSFEDEFWTELSARDSEVHTAMMNEGTEYVRGQVKLMVGEMKKRVADTTNEKKAFIKKCDEEIAAKQQEIKNYRESQCNDYKVLEALKSENEGYYQRCVNGNYPKSSEANSEFERFYNRYKKAVDGVATYKQNDYRDKFIGEAESFIYRKMSDRDFVARYFQIDSQVDRLNEDFVEVFTREGRLIGNNPEKDDITLLEPLANEYQRYLKLITGTSEPEAAKFR